MSKNRLKQLRKQRKERRRIAVCTLKRSLERRLTSGEMNRLISTLKKIQEKPFSHA